MNKHQKGVESIVTLLKSIGVTIGACSLTVGNTWAAVEIETEFGCLPFYFDENGDLRDGDVLTSVTRAVEGRMLVLQDEALASMRCLSKLREL